MIRRMMFRCRWKRILKWMFVFGIASSLSIAFCPSPSPSQGAFLPLPQQRRIKEISRLNIPKGAFRIKVPFENAIEQPSKSALKMERNTLPQESVIFLRNYSLPFLEIPKVVLQRHSNKSSEDVRKAQMMVLVLKEQGIKLSEKQEQLLKNLDVKTKVNIKEKLSEVRKMQEHTYFSLLQKNKQIEPLPSGGERVVVSQTSRIRFPASLNKIRPEEWTGRYRIYLNLTYFPWMNTPSCKDFSTIFAPPGSLKTMALASFPSSGNTWVRYLLESSCGIFTGSMYSDSSLTRKGMFGEGIVFDSGMTIIQKTHGYTTGENMNLPRQERVKKNHMEELNNQGIIIIRNPFKALISHRHLDVGGHTGYAPKSHFIGEGWKDFVSLKTNLWKEFYMDWMDASRPQDLHVVFYEDLKSNPLLVIRKILKFLHLPVDNRRLECLSKHSEGMFKRKPPKTLSLDTNPFSEDLKAVIYQAIDTLSQALEQKEKDPLPVYKYEMYNVSEAEQARRNHHT